MAQQPNRQKVYSVDESLIKFFERVLLGSANPISLLVLVSRVLVTYSSGWAIQINIRHTREHA